ncbi:MAG: hypothetical protein JW927_15300 [Deltaproteobacteria bacterium]|nr:hypothetical protein [Deltaproteobacteria bacterium]
MDIAKKIIKGLFLVLFLPSILAADVLDDELPVNAPVQIKERAREVIRLGVESQGVVKMTKAMLQNKFTEEQMVKAYEVIGDAKQNGLPVEPLMNKLHEGIGKRVKSQNIIMAMEKVKERYKSATQYAYSMTDSEEETDALTEDIVESLAAGMTGTDIETIGDMLDQVQIQTKEKSSLKTQTLATVKTMARTGARSGSVANTIQTAIKNGYDHNKMKSLEKAFINQVKANHNPSEITEAFIRGINAGTSVDEMGRHGYMNSTGSGGTGAYGNGFGNGAGMGGSGGTSGGAGSGGMRGAGGSGGSSGGGGRGGR